MERDRSYHVQSRSSSPSQGKGPDPEKHMYSREKRERDTNAKTSCGGRQAHLNQHVERHFHGHSPSLQSSSDLTPTTR
eukprot:3127162-Heterocapsa_arctica.AAC.1